MENRVRDNELCENIEMKNHCTRSLRGENARKRKSSYSSKSTNITKIGEKALIKCNFAPHPLLPIKKINYFALHVKAKSQQPRFQ